MIQTTSTMYSDTTMIRMPASEVCCKLVKLRIAAVDGLPVLYDDGHVGCIGAIGRHRRSRVLEYHNTNSVTEEHDLVTQFNQREVTMNH